MAGPPSVPPPIPSQVPYEIATQPGFWEYVDKTLNQRLEQMSQTQISQGQGPLRITRVAHSNLRTQLALRLVPNWERIKSQAVRNIDQQVSDQQVAQRQEESGGTGKRTGYRRIQEAKKRGASDVELRQIRERFKLSDNPQVHPARSKPPQVVAAPTPTPPEVRQHPSVKGQGLPPEARVGPTPPPVTNTGITAPAGSPQYQREYKRLRKYGDTQAERPPVKSILGIERRENETRQEYRQRYMRAYAEFDKENPDRLVRGRNFNATVAANPTPRPNYPGITRREGETQQEFARRMASERERLRRAQPATARENAYGMEPQEGETQSQYDGRIRRATPTPVPAPTPSPSAAPAPATPFVSAPGMPDRVLTQIAEGLQTQRAARAAPPAPPPIAPVSPSFGGVPPMPRPGVPQPPPMPAPRTAVGASYENWVIKELDAKRQPSQERFVQQGGSLTRNPSTAKGVPYNNWAVKMLKAGGNPNSVTPVDYIKAGGDRATLPSRLPPSLANAIRRGNTGVDTSKWTFGSSTGRRGPRR